MVCAVYFSSSANFRLNTLPTKVFKLLAEFNKLERHIRRAIAPHYRETGREDEPDPESRSQG